MTSIKLNSLAYMCSGPSVGSWSQSLWIHFCLRIGQELLKHVYMEDSLKKLFFRAATNRVLSSGLSGVLRYISKVLVPNPILTWQSSLNGFLEWSRHHHSQVTTATWYFAPSKEVLEDRNYCGHMCTLQQCWCRHGTMLRWVQLPQCNCWLDLKGTLDFAMQKRWRTSVFNGAHLPPWACNCVRDPMYLDKK